MHVRTINLRKRVLWHAEYEATIFIKSVPFSGGFLNFLLHITKFVGVVTFMAICFTIILYILNKQQVIKVAP